MSKRLNFSVDIEDDKIFDESVKEACSGYIKQLSREVFDSTVQNEITRLIKVKIGDNYEFNSLIHNIVRKESRILIEQQVLEFLHSEEFREMVSKCCEENIQNTFNSYDIKALIKQNMNKFINTIMEATFYEHDECGER